jgi:hypothetical protein
MNIKTQMPDSAGTSFINVIYTILSNSPSREIPLKLRGFLLSFSATNPCEAKSRYLLLQSGLLTNGIKESLDYPATADSGKPGDHK